MKSAIRFLYAVILLAVFATFAVAQESTVKGNLAGTVTDASGAVVAGAKLTVTGPNGTFDSVSDQNGRFVFQGLTPGFYTATVAKDTFKTVNFKSVEVLTGKTNNLSIKLEPGTAGTTVDVTANATTVDTTSTAVGANLTDQFYNSVPVQRNVASLFYTAPGVVNGGGTGTANPSISGGSGLENQYIADGVNITNSAYGGLGVYTQNQGAVGSGINLSFIKEVDVKEGGFEPQYGQATGGIVQIITKSGGPAYHGAISAYAAPEWGRAAEKQRDDIRTIKVGERVGRSEYEGSAELGGYVPGFRNHIFFFGSFDPTRNTNFELAPPTAGLFALGVLPQHFNTYNYAGKMTLKLSDSHSFEASVFGDPSRTNTSELTNSLASANTTNWSSWKYGTRNIVGRYNGTLSPTWLVNLSYTNNSNYFHEFPLSDVFQITDHSGPQTTVLQGFGRLEQHDAHQWGGTADTSKVVNFIGSHTFSLGYHYEKPEYTNIQNRSGGTFPLPATNYLGGAYLPAGSPIPLAGAPSDAQFSILPVSGVAGATCPICPVFNGVQVFASQTRGQFGGSGSIPTHETYQDAYFNDVWSLNKYVTASMGLRWEQEHMEGTLAKYTFTDNWSPRVGVTVDPVGDHKTKLFANFGRYSYDLPLDAAIRALSGENDVLNIFFAPVVNGSNISVVPDGAHVINNTGGFGGPALSLASLGENFLPGTKMSYENEFVVGAEHEWKGMVFSARYLDRRLQRIIEDISGTSPEGAFVHLQNFEIANPSPSLDAYVNEKEVVIPAGTAVGAFPAGCDATNTLGLNGGVAGPAFDGNGNEFSPNSVCFQSPGPGLVGGEVGADGKPDGFVNPVRNYTAFEFEVNKSFSHNYLMRINYRRAKLFGNYEGAFRNDNGQSDPGISSLFDFTPGIFGALGNQFTPGYLPTDRRNVLNAFFSYTADRGVKGLTIGSSIRVQSGTPLSVLGNHPVYTNSGEVPIGGRGALGRTPTSGQVDLKLDYPVRLSEHFTLRAGADLFNITDARPVFTVDQANARNFQPAGSNPDFQLPLSYQQPFQSRFSIKLEF